MKQEVIRVGTKLLIGVAKATQAAAVMGGAYVVASAVGKRFQCGDAARLASKHCLKEGDVQEIFLYDPGISLIVKSYLIEVAMYEVVKIKDNGSYKMRYIGSRSYTAQEARERKNML